MGGGSDGLNAKHVFLTAPPKKNTHKHHPAMSDNTTPPAVPTAPATTAAPTDIPAGKSKLLYVLLTLWLGGFGAGDFYLGKQPICWIKLVLGILCGLFPIIWIWSIVEAWKPLCEMWKMAETYLVSKDL